MSREPFGREAIIAWRVILCCTAAFWIAVVGWLVS